MSAERKFEGWGAFDKNSVKGELKWFEYEPKKFVDDDIESEFVSIYELLLFQSRHSRLQIQ